MKSNTVKGMALLLASTALVAGCGKKDVEALPPVAEQTNYGETATETPPVTNAIRPGSQEDFLQTVGQYGDRILFDTDRFNVDTEDQSVLQVQAQWLARYPNTRITVEGHADERGTRDYNLALGERRANSAKNYLISVGVDASRIQTVSYGKERPQALGSDEQSWAQNRRAVTVTIQ
ncbi:peptidoglycan-associated lipoprotein Pal [Sphingorhabdus sp. IMCC26285]|jgi:peptidoglycan-associated lipoprotein|uniref:Peptidoglycan-associated lipoprotein n=1 Tax=Sphingorhabdus profundilacus TaxID=2509718 RepID=A0A6I4M144_9SPHN|nr:peptidoglycan-associated lipoprotein Pal [Sphingorhabdus profundilacus]MVZ97976.1 peptidoglycan-associated lipoprotein Pal [Sphingorhabdus profundilacus]